MSMGKPGKKVHLALKGNVFVTTLFHLSRPTSEHLKNHYYHNFQRLVCYVTIYWFSGFPSVYLVNHWLRYSMDILTLYDNLGALCQRRPFSYLTP